MQIAHIKKQNIKLRKGTADIKIFLIVFFLISLNLLADNKENSIQRVVPVFDLRKNKTGNIEFYLDNRGTLGFDVANKRGGLFYPKGSNTQYLFGSGYIFLAEKQGKQSISYTYNPNNSESVCVPGELIENSKLDSTQTDNYQVYTSQDYDSTGQAKFGGDDPLWCIRESDDKFGKYINKVNERKTKAVFISDEDIFTTYKDTDTNFYPQYLKFQNPIGIQTEQTIYQWTKSNVKDFLLVKYRLINLSGVDLKNCLFAPIFDVQITSKLYPHFGDKNDKIVKSNVNNNEVAIIYSDTSEFERNLLLNYMFITPFVSPKINNGFAHQTLGNKINMNVRQLYVDDNITNLANLYSSLNNNITLNKNEIDQRLTLSSNTFNWKKGDSLEFSYLLGFSDPTATITDGRKEDIENVDSKIKNILAFLESNGITSIHENNNNLIQEKLKTINLQEIKTLDYNWLEVLDLTGKMLFKIDKSLDFELPKNQLLLIKIVNKNSIVLYKYLDE